MQGGIVEADSRYDFQALLGLQFRKPELLDRAFLQGGRKSIGRERRLELAYLGDGVLEVLVREYFVKRFPGKRGWYSTWRSHAASNIVFSRCYDELHLPTIESVPTVMSIRATTFEAIAGALYLDQDLSAVKHFVEPVLLQPMPRYIRQAMLLETDPLSQLERYLRRFGDRVLVFRHYGTRTWKHQELVGVLAYIRGLLRAVGWGKTIAEAKQDASRLGLYKLRELGYA